MKNSLTKKGWVFGFVFLWASTAMGQGIPVFDATEVARSIEQIQNQLEQIKKMESQLKEAQRLYDSFNKTGNLNDLLALLNDPKTRQYLPADAKQLTGLLQGQNVSGFSDIANRAQEMRAANRQMDEEKGITSFNGLTSSPANNFYSQELERIGIHVSNELAIGEKVFSSANDRQANIKKLAERVSTATDYRELANIQAMILLEMASMQNELLKIQGAAMMFKADEKLDNQRQLEWYKQQSADAMRRLQEALKK